MEDRFVARDSPGRLSLLLLVAVAAVVLGLQVAAVFGPAPRPGWEWFGWLTAAFFGLIASLIAPRLFDPRDQIVVDRSGILWRQWSDRVIPWDAISSFRIEKQHVRGFVYVRHMCLYLHEPALHPRTTWRGRGFGRGSNLGFGDITITTIGTDKSVDELAAAIERFGPGRSG